MYIHYFPWFSEKQKHRIIPKKHSRFSVLFTLQNVTHSLYLKPAMPTHMTCYPKSCTHTNVNHTQSETPDSILCTCVSKHRHQCTDCSTIMIVITWKRWLAANSTPNRRPRTHESLRKTRELISELACRQKTWYHTTRCMITWTFVDLIIMGNVKKKKH